MISQLIRDPGAELKNTEDQETAQEPGQCRVAMSTGDTEM